jgi:hypothetical protein
MVQDIHFYNEIIEIVLSEKSFQRSVAMKVEIYWITTYIYYSHVEKG